MGPGWPGRALAQSGPLRSYGMNDIYTKDLEDFALTPTPPPPEELDNADTKRVLPPGQTHSECLAVDLLCSQSWLGYSAWVLQALWVWTLEICH